ncbi:FAD-dependent urate hydroxylase-like isoform X1 [Panicum miliaceum]|uniref:FAD-dependent urate hydroxylase-like isoform X1 n=1 Tax=Panicum miliaceum TaxID=4540 RepID=A0A3L6TE63_PANMI|nr:FAD-dependent urate hydroxylase-like isoform X1 [Panicum miliaceum]
MTVFFGRRRRGRRARRPRHSSRAPQERGEEPGPGALRTAGFAFTAWKNAFRALDALGVGDKIREQHLQAQAQASGANEIRCVRRDALLQVLEEELPRGTIRYSSRIVSIQEDGGVRILHLADGSTLRAKVLIECDGINSVVARWLGLAEPSYSGRMAARGLAHFPDGHGLEPKFLQFIAAASAPACDPATRLTSTVSSPGLLPRTMAVSCVIADKGVIESGAKLKQFVLANLAALKVPPKSLAVIERSETSDVFAVPLRFRPPLSLLTASISKGGVCVAGDALHPMTPDLGQGGCAALEDSVVLARCLGEAVLGEGARAGKESRRIEAGVARVRWDPAMEERRARCYGLCGRRHSAE